MLTISYGTYRTQISIQLPHGHRISERRSISGNGRIGIHHLEDALEGSGVGSSSLLVPAVVSPVAARLGDRPMRPLPDPGGTGSLLASTLLVAEFSTHGLARTVGSLPQA